MCTEENDDDDDEEDDDDDEILEGLPDVLASPLTCPITNRPMKRPVCAADGHTYERSAITRWLMTKNKSPLTNKPLTDQTLRPNHNIKMILAALGQPKADGSGGSEPPAKKRKAMKPIALKK